MMLMIPDKKRKKEDHELLVLWIDNERKFIRDIIIMMEVTLETREFRKRLEDGQHIIMVPLVGERFRVLFSKLHIEINQDIFTDLIESKYGLNCRFSSVVLDNSLGIFDEIAYSGTHLCIHLYPRY